MYLVLSCQQAPLRTIAMAFLSVSSYGIPVGLCLLAICCIQFSSAHDTAVAQHRNTNHTSETPIRQLSDKLPEAAVDDDDDADEQTNVSFIIAVVGIAAAFVSLVVAVAVLVGRKLCASASDDRVEFARFEDEVRLGEKAMAGNPIYRPATTTYVNPMASSARSGDSEEFLMISV